MQTGPFRVNTLVVHLEGPFVFVVDPAGCEFSGDAFSLSRFLEQNGLKVALILLTHGHFDHISGLKKLKSDFPQAKVVIHQKDSPFIGSQGKELQRQSLELMSFEEFLPYVSELPEADAFLVDGKSLWDCAFEGCSVSKEISGLKKKLQEWTVMHTPGHSLGSSCVYSKTERTLIAGDTLFYQSWGRTDLPGGSESTIWKSLRRIYHELPDDTLVFPGHDYAGFTLSQNNIM